MLRFWKCAVLFANLHTHSCFTSINWCSSVRVETQSSKPVEETNSLLWNTPFKKHIILVYVVSWLKIGQNKENHKTHSKSVNKRTDTITQYDIHLQYQYSDQNTHPFLNINCFLLKCPNLRIYVCIIPISSPFTLTFFFLLTLFGSLSHTSHTHNHTLSSTSLHSFTTLSPLVTTVKWKCVFQGGEGKRFNVSLGHDPLWGVDLLRLSAPEAY